MFESNVTARVLIDGLKDEIDVSAPFEDLWYIGWINEVEQTLYSGLIEERREKQKIISVLGSPLDTSFTDIALSGFEVNPEDILAVYADGTKELTHMSTENARLFPNSYRFAEYNGETLLGIKPFNAKTVTVVYRDKPELKTVDNIETETIKLPLEFMEMLKEKIRGEAFAAVGEYTESANHLTAYNQYLDTFSQYLAMRRETFGR